MGEINYEKLKQSLKKLKEQYENFLSLDKKNLSDIDKEAVRESVIKRFEVCHDTLWKHLKKYLQTEENLVDLPNSPNKIFRRAYEAEVIGKIELKRLMGYNELRSLAAHDYSKAKADKALEQVGSFIQEAEKFYKMMTGRGKSRRAGRSALGKIKISGKKRKIDLDRDQLELLKKIIKKRIPGKKVWAYGSRAAGKAGERSDLDLAVFNCSDSQICMLKEDLDESRLLISVDVLGWESVPDSFKANIKEKYIEMQKKAP